MRRWLVTLSLVAVMAVGFAVAQDEKPKAKAQPKAKKADDSVELELGADPNPLGKKAGDAKEIIGRASYAMGLQIGRNFKQSGLNPDLKRLVKGLQDALNDGEAEMTEEEIVAAFKAMEPIARKAMMERVKALSAKNLKAGEDFLEANKDKEGVKTLASGLQYKVLAAGKGATPKATDRVRAHYRGRLVDGTVFDQSYAGDAPAETEKPVPFAVKGVIPGWTEALQKMKVGDKWRVFVPSDLAYGEDGKPPIGPNETLIFDMELVEIVK